MLARWMHRTRRRGIAWAAALGVLLAALAPFSAAAQEAGRSGEKQAPATAPSAGPYRLQPGDEVAISVTPQEEFSSDGVIAPDGTLYLKFVGKVPAAGMTLDALGEFVTKALAKEIKNYTVVPSLVRRAPPPPPPMEMPVKPLRVTVVGAVLKPGEVSLEPGMTLFKAIGIAGGFARNADRKEISVIHRSLRRTVVDLSTEERILDPEHNIPLQDGDSILVRELPEETAKYVRIRGQVANPGQYEYKPGMTIEDLITAAGKLTLMADLERIQYQPNGKPVEIVNLYARQAMGLQGKLTLQPGDEVFIPEHESSVILLGMLPKPGPRPIKPGQSLRDFLIEASSDGGVLLNGNVVDMGGVKLIRGGKEFAKVDLRAVLAKEDHKDNIRLQSGDVVFLPSQRQRNRDWLTYLQGLGPLSYLFGFF